MKWQLDMPDGGSLLSPGDSAFGARRELANFVDSCLKYESQASIAQSVIDSWDSDTISKLHNGARSASRATAIENSIAGWC